ncbi:hypothetical protein ACFL35_07285 [Candidatus Riflebacteria bacterium]
MMLLKLFLLTVFLFCDNSVFAFANDPVKRLKNLEEQLFSLKDEPVSEQPFKLLEQMQSVAKKLLFIRFDKQNYYATAIYFTRKPEKFVCRYLMADDTIHTTEFPLTEPAIPCGEDALLQLKLFSGYEIEPPVFYTGDPGEMHTFAYKKIIKIPLLKGGIVRIKLRRTDKRQLLFTIIRDQWTGLFRKYVWILDPDLKEVK